MSTYRSTFVLAGMMGVVSLGACSLGEGPSGVAQSSAFCDTVNAHVKAYLAKARAEHPTPDDPRYGGTVVVGSVADFPGGMNPALTAEYYATQYQQYVLMMPLLGLDEHYDPVPYLATSWDLNSDTTELTFHLRHDVFWHDGVQTNANDVAFTYRVVTDTATQFPNYQGYWGNYDKSDSAVTVLDDFTVRFRLRPHADFLDPWRATAILPAHLLKDVPHDQLRSHPYTTRCPVGNGPFVFDEYKTGDHWTFEANPAFPAELGGRPFVDRLVHRIIPDQGTLLSELRSGGIDIYMGAQPDQAPQIQADPALRLVTFPNREFAFVAWNSRKPQLADRRVRRALTMAIDRQGIVDAILKGYGRVATSTVVPFHWAFDSLAVRPLPYAPDSARALLAAAGWVDRNGDGVRENADGVRMSISLKTNTGRRDRALVVQAIQSQLKEVGVEVRPEFVESGTLQEQVFGPTRDFDGIMTSWIQDFKFDDSDLFLSSRVDQPYNMSGTHDSTMDRYLDTLQLVLDHKRAKPLWIDYEKALQREQPYTFLYYVTRVVGVRRAVHDTEMDARGEWVNVRKWWLDPDGRRGR